MSLDNLINSNIEVNDLNQDLLHKWDHIISVISEDDIYIKTVEKSEGNKYIFDFNGLLESLNIPEKYWYPHIRLNNFKSFTEYDGRTSIYLLENAFLDKMYSIIRNNSLE